MYHRYAVAIGALCVLPLFNANAQDQRGVEAIPNTPTTQTTQTVNKSDICYHGADPDGIDQQMAMTIPQKQHKNLNPEDAHSNIYDVYTQRQKKLRSDWQLGLTESDKSLTHLMEKLALFEPGILIVPDRKIPDGSSLIHNSKRDVFHYHPDATAKQINRDATIFYNAALDYPFSQKPISQEFLGVRIRHTIDGNIRPQLIEISREGVTNDAYDGACPD